MAIRFSHEVIKSMGFSPVSTTEPIIASFHSLHVYAVQGLTLEGTLATVSRGALNGTAYSVGLCTSLNSLAQELINDNLADDEPSWAQEHPGWPDFVFAFHGNEELGPRMLARIAKRTGLSAEDL
jgi:hypothetical protein